MVPGPVTKRGNMTSTNPITLKTYTAVLRHAGNLLHEIPVEGEDGRGVTERELRYLRHLHGAENIVKVQEVGKVEVDETLHYYNIVEKYGSNDDFTKQEMVKAKVEKLFNVELHGFNEYIANKADTKPKVTFRDAPVVDESALREKIEAEMRAKIEAEVRAKIAAEQPSAPPSRTLGLPGKQPVPA